MEEELIRYLLLDQQDCVFLVYSASKLKDKIKQKLKNFYEKIDKSKAEMFADTLRSYCGISGKEEPDLSRKMAQFFLENNKKDQIVDSILPYITGEKDINSIDEVSIHNMVFFVLVFKETYNSCFEVFYDKMLKIIERIGIDNLRMFLGPDFLSLLKDPPCDYLRTYEIDEPTIIDLFKNEICFTNNEACNILQERLTKMYPFPKKFPYIQDPLFNLANTSIVEKVFGIDILAKDAFEFISSFQYDDIPLSLKYFPETVPYFIVANYQIIYANLQEANTLLAQNFPKSLACDLVKRFSNDAHLIEMISFMRGDDCVITSADLMDSSLVYHLQYTLGNPVILKYADMKYYLISDEDAQNDFDFIYAYSAFRLFFSIFKLPQTAAKSIVDNVNDFLKKMKSKDMREKVVIDMFSFLFFQKMNRFLCTTYLAKTIIKMLSNYTNNTYVTTANSMLQSKYFWQKEPEFKEFFTRNPADIFEAIDSKNWVKANELTMSTPYYRKIYILALCVDAFLKNMAMPEEADKYQNLLKLEIALSSFSFDLLEGSFGVREDCDQIIKGRKNNSEPLSVIPNDQWETVNEFVEIFNSAAEFDESLLLTAQKSKLLYDFASYISLYRSVNHSDDFDIEKAISKAFVDGKMKEAEELCKKANKSLMELILLKRDCFPIDESFIKAHYDEFKLEFIALMLTEKDFSVLRTFPSIPATITKLISREAPKEENEQEFAHTIVELACSGSLDFEDILYRTDHHTILKLLLEYGKEFNETMISLLDLVSYSASKEEGMKVFDIKLEHELSKEKGSNADKINSFIAKGKRECAFRYIEILNEKNEDVIDLLYILFDSQKNDPLFLTKIISTFQNYFIPLFSKYGYEFIHQFKCSCGKENAQLLDAFMKLPEPIYKQLSTFDADQAIDALIKQPEMIFELTKVQMPIVNDERLMKLVKCFTKPKDILKAVSFLFDFFENKKVLEAYATDVAVKIVKLITVDSSEKEDQAKKSIKIAAKLFSVFNESKSIKILQEIIDYSLFTELGYKYSFSEYDTPEFPSYLMRIAFECDIPEIVDDICCCFNVTNDYYLGNVAYVQSILGLHIEAKETKFSPSFRLEDFELKGWSKDNKLFFNKNVPFLRAFFFAPTFPVLFARTLINNDIEIVNIHPMSVFMSVYNGIKECAQKLLENERDVFKQNPVDNTEDHIMHSQLMIHARFFLVRYCSRENSVSILNAMKEYDTSYQILWGAETEQERINIFVNHYFISGIAYQNMDGFTSFIKLQDPTLALSAGMLDELQSFMAKKHMNEGLYFVYQFRNYLEDQAMVALNMFSKAKSLQQKYSLTGKAYVALDQAIRCRTSPNNKLVPPFKPSLLSLGELKDTLELVSLQLRFCQFCFEAHRVKITEDMDLINNPDSAAKIAAALLIDGKDEDLYNAIVQTTNVSRNDVIRKAGELLINNQPNDSYLFLSNLKNKDSNLALDLMRKYLMHLSKSMNFVFIPMFVSLEDDPRKRALLNLDFDNFAEALEIIITNKLHDLIGLVAMRASQVGDVMTLASIQKQLK